MPCQSDYLNASQFETESRMAAGLIVYLEGALGHKPPAWVVQCAKNYYGAADRQDGKPGQGGDKRLVPHLCALVKTLTPEQRERFVYNGHNPTARGLASFVEAHEAADARRAALLAERDDH